jgi:hypothetical protein
MKVFGLWERLTRIKFFDGKEITVEPATQSGASDKTINIPDMGADAAQTLVLDKQTQTLEKKTLTSPVIDGTAATPAAGKVNVASAANKLLVTGENGSAATISTESLTNGRTFTLPDTSGILVTRSDSGTITSAMIADGTIVDGDVSATAAIAGTKVSPNFGAQTITTTGDLSVTNATVTGLNTAGVVHNSVAGALSTSLIVDADVSATANIAGSKLADTSVSIGKLSTVLADANKVIRRDGTGVIVSGNSIPDNTAILTQDGANSNVKLKTFDGLVTQVADSALTNLSPGTNEVFATNRTGLITLTASVAGSYIVNQINVQNSEGQHLVILNRSGGSVLIDNESGSNASRQIITGTGGPVSLADKAALFLVYRTGTVNKWTVVGGTGGGAGGTVTQVTTPAPHGFTNAADKGKVLYLNGTTYTSAIATAANTAEVVGILANVIDADTFELATGGAIEVISADDFEGGSVPGVGEAVFLSASEAGKMTATEPSVVGQVSKPLGIIFSSSPAKMFFYNMRGTVVGAANARTTISLANNTTTSVQDAANYEAGSLAGTVFIDGTVNTRFYVQAQFAKNGNATDFNLSYQTTGDTPPTGFSVSITAAGMIQVTLPNVAGFTSAYINYALNAPAVGATLPLSISVGSIVPDGSAISPLGFANVTSTGNFNITSTGPSLYRVVVASPAAPITAVLPTNVKAGYRVRIEVELTGSTETNCFFTSPSIAEAQINGTGFVELMALIDNPSTAANWKVLDVSEVFWLARTWTLANASGSYNLTLSRRNKLANIRIPNINTGATITNATAAMDFGSVPTRYAIGAGVTMANVAIRYSGNGGLVLGAGLFYFNNASIQSYYTAAGAGYPSGWNFNNIPSDTFNFTYQLT